MSSHENPDDVHKENSGDSPCCDSSTPSQGDACCPIGSGVKKNWKVVVFILVALLAAGVTAHSLLTEDQGCAKKCGPGGAAVGCCPGAAGGGSGGGAWCPQRVKSAPGGCCPSGKKANSSPTCLPQSGKGASGGCCPGGKRQAAGTDSK